MSFEDHLDILQSFMNDFGSYLFLPMQVVASGIIFGMLIFLIVSFIAFLSTVVFYYIPLFYNKVYVYISSTNLSLRIPLPVSLSSTDKEIKLFKHYYISYEGSTKSICLLRKEIKPSWLDNWEIKLTKVIFKIKLK